MENSNQIKIILKQNRFNAFQTGGKESKIFVYLLSNMFTCKRANVDFPVFFPPHTKIIGIGV